MLLAWSMVSRGVDGMEGNKLGSQVLDMWWEPVMLGTEGVWSCHPVLGLLGRHQLPNLPVGWGRWHGDLPLDCREINLLPPQSGQVSFRIQQRVPITPFEDWICGPKVTHHLQQARLPRGGINQWAVVVLQL